MLISFVTLEKYSRTCFTNVRLEGTLPVSPQIAWFEVLAHNAEALHSGRTRTFVLRASCTTLALFTEDGLMRGSTKAKRARDLCKKWGVILDSMGPSLIVLTVEYYSIISTAGIHLPHLLSRWSSIKQTMRETLLNVQRYI